MKTSMTTKRTMTDTEIATLQQEAAQAGDNATVALCTRAMGGDADAMARIVGALPAGEDTAHGLTFGSWLTAAGRSDSASEYDLRAAWSAGESPEDYRR
jgi:hypothetical protein